VGSVRVLACVKCSRESVILLSSTIMPGSGSRSQNPEFGIPGIRGIQGIRGIPGIK
jgi:hypothetical protein